MSEKKIWKGFTLRITFEGLCAFLPNSPFFVYNAEKKGYDPGDPKKLSVVLPDARSPGIADWEQTMPLNGAAKPFFLRSSHAPLLALRPYDIADMQDFDIDGFVGDPSTQDLRHVHVLDYELITFDLGRRQPQRLRFCHEIPHHQDRALPGEHQRLRHSLWWIPRLSEIQPDYQYSDLADKCAEVFPTRGVAARIEVPGGHLSVTEFNSQGLVAWNFGTVGRAGDGNLMIPGRDVCTWKRAIATKVCCDVEVKSAMAYVVVNDDEGNRGWVGLQPSEGQDRVEVAVINGEMESFTFRYTQPWVTANLPDVDFQALYGLSSCARKCEMPVPIAHGYSGFDRKPCASAAFSGASATPEEG